jgi:hypothetical protein
MRERVFVGVVVEFDQRRGLGFVKNSAGERHLFHATSIADGTRFVSIGCPVTGRLRPTHGGAMEIVDLRSTANETDQISFQTT